MDDNKYFIGLISGTSADGIDAAIIKYDDQEKIKQVAFDTYAYPDQLRTELIQVINNNQSMTLAEFGRLDAEVGDAFTEAVNSICTHAGIELNKVDAIGSHGQTIYHAADQQPPYSIQLGDPNRIAYKTNCTVVADFRRMDLAAGGQAAPLAPLLHETLFRSAQINRIVINLGGISNITYLPADQHLPVIGFDTGPASCLMDAWCLEHTGQAYDNNGQWAKTGTLIPSLLQALLNEPYFDKLYPKSTGREYFNSQWISAKYPDLEKHATEDVQATLLTLTQQTISNAIKNICTDAEIILCGGGVYNQTLVSALQQAHPQQNVCTTATMNYDPNAIEALLFAWLAAKRFNKQVIDTRSITGAQSPFLLGNIFQAR